MPTISLQVVLLSVVLAVAIIAAAVSFAPLQTASMDSALRSGQAFSASISSGIAVSVGTYFAKMQATASIMTASAKLGGWAINDTAGILKWMAYGNTLGADSINMIFDAPVMWTAGQVTPSNQVLPAGQFALVMYNNTHAHLHVINTTDLSELSYSVSTNSLNFRGRAYFKIIRKAQGWGAPFIGVSLGISEAVLPCGAPIVDPNGTAIGAFYVRTRAAVIVNYFKTLQVAETGRAMLIDPATGLFVASNSPLDPLTLTLPNGTVVVASYTDVKDPLIRNVVGARGSALLTCSPMPCTLDFGSGSDLVYVTVTSVDDAFRLNKRLVVMIPSDDFLGQIRKASNTSLGAAAGAVVGLLLLSFVAVYLIVRPLIRLEEHLYASVSLQEEQEGDGAPSSKSFISEIYNIQEAYDTLKAELVKVKSFLPQSVLKQLEAEAKGEDGEEDGDDEGEMTDVADVEKQQGLKRDGSRVMDVQSVATSKRSHTYSMVSHSLASGSDRRRGLGQGSKTLNNTSALAQRNCTVVCANLDGFHKVMKAKTAQELLSLHTEVMRALMTEADACKGVLEAFHGDRFTVSFNASTNCASHCTKGAAFMTNVATALRTSSGSVARHMRFGAATGKALCGVMGTDKIKHFCVVGPAVNHAFALCGLCRTFEVPNLVNHEALKSMQFEYSCDSVSIYLLPHAEAPVLIGTVKERRSTKADEWMYELEEGAKKSALAAADPVVANCVLVDTILEMLLGVGDLSSAVAEWDASGKFKDLSMLRVKLLGQLLDDRKAGKPFPQLFNS